MTMSELHIEKEATTSQEIKDKLNANSVNILEINNEEKNKPDFNFNAVRQQMNLNTNTGTSDGTENITLALGGETTTTSQSKDDYRNQEIMVVDIQNSDIGNNNSAEKHKRKAVAASNSSNNSNGNSNTNEQPSSSASILIPQAASAASPMDNLKVKIIARGKRSSLSHDEKKNYSDNKNQKPKATEVNDIRSQIAELARLNCARTGLKDSTTLKTSTAESFALDYTEELGEQLYAALLDKIVKQVAFDIHREAKLEHIWLDDEEVVKERLDTKDIYHINEAFVSQLLCVCPNCGRKVGSSRFAPHLDKCNQRSVRDRKRKVRERSSRENAAVKLNPIQLVGKKENSLSTWVPGDAIPCWACGKVESPPTVICDGCDRMYHKSCLMKTDGDGEGDGVSLPPVEIVPEVCFCSRCLPNIELVINSPRINRRKRKLPISNSKATEIKLESGRVPAPYEILEFYCDICNKVIINSRWRCLHCNNFDSCMQCFDEKKTRTRPEAGHAENHQSYHHMVKIKIRKSPDGGPTRH